MKGLWWYGITMMYLGLISNMYLLLVERTEPTVNFFAVVFTIPFIIFLHKIKGLIK